MKYLTNVGFSYYLPLVPGVWYVQILYEYLQHFAQGYAMEGVSLSGQKDTAEGRRESGDSFMKEHLAHFIITLWILTLFVSPWNFKIKWWEMIILLETDSF